MINLTANCIEQWTLNDNLPSTVVLGTKGYSNGVHTRNTEDVHIAEGLAGDQPPYLNGCFVFNPGANDYIFGGNPANLQFTSNGTYTYEIWFYVADITPDDSTTLLYAGADAWELSLATDGRVYFINLDTTENAKSGVLSALTWYQVLVTFNAGNCVLYIDNNQVDTLIDDFVDDATGIYIGGGGTAELFDGFIDCVAVYNKVLNADERAFRYNGGNGTEVLNKIPVAIHHYQMAGGL